MTAGPYIIGIDKAAPGHDLSAIVTARKVGNHVEIERITTGTLTNNDINNEQIRVDRLNLESKL